MKPDRLERMFCVIGDAPEAIGGLRKLVVALALSDKLVNSADEGPGPQGLMERIDQRKQELVRSGQLQKGRPTPPVTQEELPHGLPLSARIVRLGAVANIEKGPTGIAKAKPGPYPLVVTAEERAACDHFDFDGAAAIVPLVSSTGHGKASLHRLHYQEGRFALGSILAAIFPYAPEVLSARFIFEYLSAFKEELIVSRMIGTANVSLSISKVGDVPVRL
jgi:type I restriction enzyme S subunit